MIFKHYKKPESMKEAYELLLKEKSNLIIGGGAWLKLQPTSADTVIDLSLLGLDTITSTKDVIEMGSMVTLRDIETNHEIQELAGGIFSKAVKSIMGMNIRNIATIGGSIVGKYSFSDILTPLLTMETTLVFHNSGEVSLEDFLANKKFPKDILVKLIIKKQPLKAQFKTVKKTALDFAVLNLAISKGKEYKVVVGARPGRPIRALQTEKLLNDGASNDVALETLLEEISLSKNARGSEEYRTELLKVYFKRLLTEVQQ